MSRAADQIWGQVQDTATSNPEAAEVTAAIAKLSGQVAKLTDEGGLNLSHGESQALGRHLDCKRSGNVDRRSFEKFYHEAKLAEGRGIGVEDIMRAQAMRRGTLSLAIAGMLAYVFICGAVLMVLEKDAERRDAEQFLAGKRDFCEGFFAQQNYNFTGGETLADEIASLGTGSVGEVSCNQSDTNSCPGRLDANLNLTERHCH